MSLYPPWWRRNFLMVEFILVGIAAMAYIIWVWKFGGSQTIETTLKGDRGPLYSALASIWGALLGFVITAVSIALGYASNPRLKVLRDSAHYKQLWNIFAAASRILGLATLAALGGLIFDRNNNVPNQICLAICLWTSLLASARLSRCLWALQGIINIVTTPPAS